MTRDDRIMWAIRAAAMAAACIWLLWPILARAHGEYAWIRAEADERVIDLRYGCAPAHMLGTAGNGFRVAVHSNYVTFATLAVPGAHVFRHPGAAMVCRTGSGWMLYLPLKP